MSFIITAIVFVLIFSVLVLIHEAGHYFMAKRSGIKVEEFGFGLPPRIWGVKKGETIYSINAIPFGGFVRLLGEDSRDPKASKNPRSFTAKSARTRILVIVAGVVMNFLLAIFLLTIGFTFGIQPLILSSDDVLNSIQDGTIQIQPGVTVKSVLEGDIAEKAGIKVGDKILRVNGKEISSNDVLQSAVHAKNSTAVVDVLRGTERLSFQLQTGEKTGLGFTPFDVIFLPRLVVLEVQKNITFLSGDIQPGDVVLKINGKNVYSYNEYSAELSKSTKLEMVILRDDNIVNTVVNLPVGNRVIVTNVFPDSPAEKAAFQPADIIQSVSFGAGEQPISFPDDVVALTKQYPGKPLIYTVLRGEETKTLQVQPDDKGLIGVGLSTLTPYENQFITVYTKDQPSTVLAIQDVRYPFWVAPFKAVDESFRLAGLTVQTFGNVLHSFFTRFTIPEGVSGPIGIAQMTYTFVQEGVLSLLRFMALLSMSLAIINILPFPALDGGRFFFILIEIILGRRIDGKWEAVIHTIGFALLMLLIVAVSFSDIMKLF